MKFFCIAGPVNPEKHYYLPLDTRLDEQELRTLIEQDKYFALHAPRQTGKTSAIMNFVGQLNRKSQYIALYVNIEPAQAARNDFVKGMSIILAKVLEAIIQQLPQEKHIISYLTNLVKENVFSGASLGSALSEWSRHTNKPILLFIDEIDSLVGDTLISVLRQLRAGYANRPHAFPQSVCLITKQNIFEGKKWPRESWELAMMGGSLFKIWERIEI
jgi:predicted AAA+ superfamily ATPase